MNKKLYNLMDWGEMEAITYSEEEHPKKILGPHGAGSQTLIQAFLPLAKSVSVLTGKTAKPVPMELAEESGHYAVLVRKKYPFHYRFKVENEDGTEEILEDPYAFPQIIPDRALKKLKNGILFKAWEYLGAHIMEEDEVKGVHFAVWAPEAMRVSVVGDFNGWDGRVHEMELLGESGVFELFIPGVKEGDLYKYEIKGGNGTVQLKADPFGFCAEKRPGTASVVSDISAFTWTDEDWLTERAANSTEEAPMAVYELYLRAFAEKGEDGSFSNYREMAPRIAKYVKDTGYTHIELMPVMEHPSDETLGYQTLGYYAPTSRYGSPADFAYFMNYMHEKGIGVILDWSPAHFPCTPEGLMRFDGSCVYESADPKRSFHPEWGTLTFDFSRPEVRNYLIANALFWISIYHADGIRAEYLSSLLYLDYGRNEGDYTPNIYGGKENLDGIVFCKELTEAVHALKKGALCIAEETSAWPQVTDDTESGGLGFDYKWNTSWRKDFLDYMAYDPLYRTHHYGELCFSIVYSYAERFFLPLTHDAFSNGQGSFVTRMPGDGEEKLSNAKAGFCYFMTHPGKKLFSMGLDMGEEEEWDGSRPLNLALLEKEENKQFHDMVKDMISLYKERPALHRFAHNDQGFEWINCISANENILVYLRKTDKKEETLLVVANFANTPRKNYKIGVPFEGKYKEIFNSDAEQYGGFDLRNHRILKSQEDECDGRKDSIRIKVPPLAVIIFEVQAL